MRSGEVQLVNELGLHARASAKFVHVANRFASDVRLEFEGTEVAAKSILGLLLLAAPCGSTLTLTCDGEDEDECFSELQELLAVGFGELPERASP